MRKNLTKNIVSVGIFAAFSICLYLPTFRFSLGIFPPFLKIQFSMLPIIIGGFILGPFWGSLILVVKTIVLLPMSNTSYIGELADFLIGISVVLSSTLFYKLYKGKFNDLIALLIGIATWIISAIIVNTFILVPLYIELYFKGALESFIEVCSLIPGINNTNYMMKYIIYALIPFNFILSFLVSTVTYLTHKKLKKVYEIVD